MSRKALALTAKAVGLALNGKYKPRMAKRMINWEPYALIALLGMMALALLFQREAKWLWRETCPASKAIFCLLVGGVILRVLGQDGLDCFLVFGPQAWLVVVSNILFVMAGALVLLSAIIWIGRNLPKLPRRHNRRRRQTKFVRGGKTGADAFKSGL